MHAVKNVCVYCFDCRVLVPVGVIGQRKNVLFISSMRMDGCAGRFPTFSYNSRFSHPR